MGFFISIEFITFRLGLNLFPNVTKKKKTCTLHFLTILKICSAFHSLFDAPPGSDVQRVKDFPRIEGAAHVGLTFCNFRAQRKQDDDEIRSAL